jgi:hypothetical protein
VSQINSREICLLASQIITTSGNGPDIVVPMGWQAATVSININTVTGTSPTWNVFLQKRLRQASATDLVGTDVTGTAIYDDLLAFTTLTTNATRICNIVTGELPGTANATIVTTADYAQSDAALGFGSLRIGPLGPTWRMKWVVAGTTPSGTVSVTAQLIPWST